MSLVGESGQDILVGGFGEETTTESTHEQAGPTEATPASDAAAPVEVATLSAAAVAILFAHEMMRESAADPFAPRPEVRRKKPTK